MVSSLLITSATMLAHALNWRSLLRLNHAPWLVYALDIHFYAVPSSSRLHCTLVILFQFYLVRRATVSCLDQSECVEFLIFIYVHKKDGFHYQSIPFISKMLTLSKVLGAPECLLQRYAGSVPDWGYGRRLAQKGPSFAPSLWRPASVEPFFWCKGPRTIS